MSAIQGNQNSNHAATGLLANRNVLYGFILLCQLPAILGYFRRVWSAGHYQFAILLIPIVVWMMKERLESVKGYERGAGATWTVLLLACAGFMVLSTFVAPMFWILAFMALILCYVYDNYGIKGFKQILPLWLVLLVVVPMPRGLDDLLITRLQGIASGFASWILDAFGMIHFRNGVVLVTEKDQFFTEEACSGIRSLFSSLAVMALYGVHQKYGIFRCLFLLLMTLVWVLVGNAIRIATVVWCSDNWTNAIATGWPHDLLGLLTFGLIVLLTFSTDRILSVAVEMYKSKEVDESFEDPVIDAVVQKQHKTSRIGNYALVVLAGFSLLLAFCGFRLMTSKAEGHLRNPLFAMPDFQVSDPDDLPQKIGEWTLTKFEPIDRGEDMILAAQSYVWHYEKDGVQAQISVDGPWEFWHDITACYRGIGWVTSTNHDFDGVTASGEPKNYSQIELSKVSGEEALVLFAQHDLAGKPVRPSLLGGVVSLELIKLNFLQNLRSIFGIKGRLDSGFRQYRLPLATVQLFCPNAESLTEAQEQELESLYLRCRELLLASGRFETP